MQAVALGMVANSLMFLALCSKGAMAILIAFLLGWDPVALPVSDHLWNSKVYLVHDELTVGCVT